MAMMSVDGQYYQVRIKYLLHGQQCYNVLNFLSRGSLDLNTALLQPILACVTTHLIPILSVDLTVQGADVKNITGSVAQETEEALETDNVGETTGDGLPSTNAAVVSLRSSHAGRSGRGRFFLPGIPESKQATSQLDPTFIAAAIAFCACMFTAFHDADPLSTPLFHWVIYSRKDSTGYTVESYAPKAIVATMRSRKVS